MNRFAAIILAFTGLFAAACTKPKPPEPPADPFAAYLPWKADAKLVKSIKDGPQYIVLKEGPKDGAVPGPADRVTVNYDVRLADGTPFDSSFLSGTPARMFLNETLPGWSLGLSQMSQGDDYLFYIPAELAFGDMPPPGTAIKPGDDLVCRLELVSVEKHKEYPPATSDLAAWQKYKTWNAKAPEVKTTASGLQYVILKSGDPAGLPPRLGQEVVVHYEGRLAKTNALFDSSFQRGAPARFPSDQLVPGWVEALQLMRPGDRWMLYLPSNIGYGERGTPDGSIPSGADLIFELEVLDVIA